MEMIREIAEQALNSGFLSVESENKLRMMLRSKYELEDLEAFINLQQAAMIGIVKQESRELFVAARKYS